MKFEMKTSFELNCYLIWLIWLLCRILGSQSIETATELPQDILEAVRNADPKDVRQILNNSRRIIMGAEATHKRPYMVYLKLPSTSAKFQDYRRWLCGGVIIHEEYILTSAACIEDVKHFYVVSGTYKFSFDQDRFNNPCIKNGAKKAVWKCIPRNYVFDGHENDNIRWMNNDIAVVKLEDEFDFTRRVRGCDYAPRPICYNNQSVKFEAAGTPASIAGWGSIDKYNDWVNSRRNSDVTNLLEVGVRILGKGPCKKRWGQRYHNIIENYMVCTDDLSTELSEICLEKYVDCSDMLDDSDEESRRSWNPEEMGVHSANHNYSMRRQFDKIKDGGFCENDHGGPLIHGTGISAMVIGIISACLVKEKTNRCYGPFLYTSVYKNRMLINCAIYKNIGTDCSKLFRSTVTYTEVNMNWFDHADGPAKSELIALRRREEEERRLLRIQYGVANDTKPNTTYSITVEVDRDSKSINEKQNLKEDLTMQRVGLNSTNEKQDINKDLPMQRVGLILRSRDEDKNDTTRIKLNSTTNEKRNPKDIPIERIGLILRTRDDDTNNTIPDKQKISTNEKRNPKDIPIERIGLILRSRDGNEKTTIPLKQSSIINEKQNSEDMPMERIDLTLRTRDDDKDVNIQIKPAIATTTEKRITKQDTPIEQVGLILRSRDYDGYDETPVNQTSTPKTEKGSTKDISIEKIGLILRSRNDDEDIKVNVKHVSVATTKKRNPNEDLPIGRAGLVLRSRDDDGGDDIKIPAKQTSPTATGKQVTKGDIPIGRAGLVLRSRDDDDDDDIKIPAKQTAHMVTGKQITKKDIPIGRVGLVLRSGDDDDDDIKIPVKQTSHMGHTTTTEKLNSNKDLPMQRVGLILRSRDDDDDIEISVKQPTTDKISVATS